MRSVYNMDFSKLVEEMKVPKKGRSDLNIFGGQCIEKDIMHFLEQWDLTAIPYRIWEYVSTIEFKKDTLPENTVLLERGRLFGDGGDLLLRRNSTGFNWRFIGSTGVRPPAGDYHVQNFWDVYPDVSFHQYRKTALLWGEFNGERRVENRVAAAKLDYPAEGKRIALVYKVFCHAGQVEFVWYTGLVEWEVADDA